MSIVGFQYDFQYAGLVDAGRKRESNQDEIVMAPALGLFAVSDGMGGLAQGGIASAYVREALPDLVETYSQKWGRANNVLAFMKTQSDAGTDADMAGKMAPDAVETERMMSDAGAETVAACPDIGEIAQQMKECAGMLSDCLYEEGNTSGWYCYGATLVSVMLYGQQAVFTCLGDSRGYHYSAKDGKLIQVTEDMNIAGCLVRCGQMTESEAAGRPERSRLTAFVGMEEPATPEAYAVDLEPGDGILLCSDGLYSMVPKTGIEAVLGEGRSAGEICQRLIDQANENGGEDNISAVYISIQSA